jgi:hypothetical protein
MAIDQPSHKDDLSIAGAIMRTSVSQYRSHGTESFEFHQRPRKIYVHALPECCCAADT